MKLLNEDYVNAGKDDLVFTWPCNDGKIRDFVFGNPKTDIYESIIRYGGQPATAQWFATVYLNFIKRGGFRNSQTECSLRDFIVDRVADIAWGNISSKKEAPSAEMFGNGNTNDHRIYPYLYDQAPFASKDSFILFPWGFETYYEMNDPNETRNCELLFGCMVADLKDYLDYLVSQNKKLDRMSVEEASRGAVRWHHLQVKAAEHDVDGVDIKTVLDFGDGYKIVRLLTPKALDRESARCDHCIGKGGYDAAVTSGVAKIFSLRDTNGDENIPLATIEVRGKEVLQVKGRSNGPVGEAVRKHVVDFIIRAGLTMKADHEKIGLKRLDIDEGNVVDFPGKMPDAIESLKNFLTNRSPIAEIIDQGDVVVVNGTVCDVLKAKNRRLLLRPRDGSEDRIVDAGAVEVAHPSLW